ncbi:recombinase family protein [Apilactobacillus timberlakei]|uniref:recombinase family protein n=1 Tax=Apilactobacillus timberlakei TaxID=2008380 RepID=UPI00112A5906|nr:recombinase family protein [Apilactobacillus timberlakei]TPR12131.1 recombinase family protein [Apilactobacillus timberlakei]
MIYGYARVSTAGQSLKEQLQEIRKENVLNKNIYHEKFTGTTTHRPVLEELMNKLKSNDTLVVTKLDRLARKTSEAIELIEKLMNMDVTIKVINLGTLENTSMGRMIYRTLLSVAEMERDMIVERTQAGKVYAKQHNPNYHEGRPSRAKSSKKDNYKAIYEYKKYHTAKETASAFNISTRTVFYVNSLF